MSAPDLKLTATAVRVPVVGGHSESVNITLSKPTSVSEIQSLLHQTDGVKVLDDPTNSEYPMPANCEGENDVFVGRIRKDQSAENAFNLWIVADNLRKGAATNAIQILERMITAEYFRG